MNTIPAKTIITRKPDTSWFGTEYNMNIYKGCCHGCIYCDSRSDCYQIENFDTVRIKERSIDIIGEELRRKVKTGVVGTGSMSDPYNPLEERLQLTRQALELIDNYHFGVAIATKGALITRDIDVLSRIKEHSPVICKITVTTIDDELCSKIEPNADSSSLRIAAIRELTKAGIFTGILMMPLLPYLSDTIDNVQGIIHTAHANGARFIFPLFGVTLRSGQREYYYRALEQQFPGQKLKQQYMQTYGSSYECHSPKEAQLRTVFQRECDKLGILYRMEDIIRAYKSGYDYRQLSLFQ